MDGAPGEITTLLNRLTAGDRNAESRLVPLVYKQLRRMAAHHMRGERPNHTLQATALVHEAYLRLIRQDEVNWKGRAHFFGVAARLMRQILVDHARAARAEKRPGGHAQVPLEENLIYSPDHQEGLIALDDALSRLGEIDPRQCRVVELRYFAGLSVEETAEALDVSVRTVKRDWNMARAWLHGELAKT